MPDVVSISHMHRCTHMYRDGLHSHTFSSVGLYHPYCIDQKTKDQRAKASYSGCPAGAFGSCLTEQFDSSELVLLSTMSTRPSQRSG